MALLRLADELHHQSPQVYVNATVGTWPSPFWLNHLDCTWRGDTDLGDEGVGTTRERRITYRDAQTYRGVVALGPLYPLNSLMVVGTVFNGPSGTDLRHDLLCLFGSGTSLQELYITPSVMTSDNWDQLAEFARWSRENETY